MLIAHNIRSTHNIGSLLRTADGLGAKMIISGYSPYPKMTNDTRLPHVSDKLTRQISKTALGAEKSGWEYSTDVTKSIADLREQGFQVIALEQAKDSIKLPDFKPSGKIVMLLGSEVRGIESSLIRLCDKTVEVPMFGSKESFNVATAASMALYHCRFAS